MKLKRRTRASGQTAWRAHYLDPDSGKEVAKTLDGAVCPTHEARTVWAKKLSLRLARRRMDRAAGIAPPPEPIALAKTVKDYLVSAEARLRPNTVESYGRCLARLLRWADAAGVVTTSDLHPRELAALKDFLIRDPKAAVKRGAKRGARKAGRAKRSVNSVNCDIRSIKVMLNDLRKRGMLPHLHRDDIADTLTALRVPRDPPPFLTRDELRQLLTAALRHDADCFTATRAEHLGQRRPGTTPRHQPIAPFVAFVLLTGMRRNEALLVPWSAVHLDARDRRGDTVGEIRLPASITKTQRARQVGLEVSPAIRRTLAAVKLRSGRRSGTVFGYTVDLIERARARLISRYGAPAFDWQLLRSTCATYLTNAPGIFGGSSVFMSAKQLGHSVAVAERHYLGVERGIPHDAVTLEAAMEIEDLMSQVISSVATPRDQSADTATS